ncbi:hypothetical protein KC345_g10459, partial [Hortaea werneckii]
MKGGKPVSEDILLQMTNVTKTFPGVKALNGVDFALRRGEVHGLMGENGAGKSTLIKVLTGVYEMDEGAAYLGGRRLNISSPQEAQNEGISTVYQEVNLCSNLTVAENIYIGRLPKTGGAVDWKRMNKGSEQLLARLNLFIDVKQPLSAYSVAIQQMIAIARAVDMSSGVLILDEPTSSLDKQEVKQLFAVMSKLRSEGMGIVFVTHFLDQVYEITDRITVLRNGSFVGEYKTEELPKSSLVSKMIGREWTEQERVPGSSRERSEAEVFLSVQEISRKGSIEPVSMQIRKGEIVGIAGLLGSGRTELAKLIFGIDKADQGVISIGSETISSMYPKAAIRKGLGFCPEDRKEAGIVGELTIRENIALALQAKKGLFSYIPLRRQQELAAKFIDLLRIKTPGMEQRLDHLSGGNQQKVILARWLATEPDLLILDEPTRGIDVGSKGEIRSLILRLAQSGISILMISSELQEMIECCDRIIVLRDRVQIGEDMTLIKRQAFELYRSKIFWPLAALALLLLINLILTPGFFTIEVKNGHLFGTLIDILNRAAPLVIIAIGMTLVIAKEGIDISVGAVLAISGAVSISLLGHFPVWLAVPAAMGIGLLCGLWNGVLVAYFGIQPMVGTLILMTVGRGIAQLITNGQIITTDNFAYGFIGKGFLLGLPFPVFIAAAVYLLVFFLKRKTAFGLFLEAIGVNKMSSEYAGLQPRTIYLFVYSLSGLCAAIAGLIVCSNLSSADANNAGLWIELDAILAVVIGGT